MAKVEATRRYGARVEMGGERFEDAVAAGRRSPSRDGATYVHAFEDRAVIAGQGTIGLEIVEQVGAWRRWSCRSGEEGWPRASRSRCSR